MVALVVVAGIAILTTKTAQEPPKITQSLQSAQTSVNNSLPELLGDIQTYTAINPSSRLPFVNSRAYLLLDGETNEILLGQGAHNPIPIASTTKMMSALVVVKKMDLNNVITVSSQAVNVSGAKIGLKDGQRLKTIDLLKAMLIASGNDAAYAIAFGYSQSGEDDSQFINSMNQLARDLGLKQTRFMDPAGLDDNGRSTPFELSQIARELLRHPVLRKIVQTSNTEITALDGEVFQLENTNRLVRPETAYYFQDAVGIKTGFTYEAGHCLVAAFDHSGHTLVGVVMNTYEYTPTASAKVMKQLFDWASTNVEIKQY